MFHILFLISLIFVANEPCFAELPDPSGYVMYCPCMGRFGNQADHFLGSLAFAKALNRTLVIPPWVEYPKGAMRSNQVPYDYYFKVEPLLKYHRAMLMWDFMEQFGDSTWPHENRTSFCYMERQALRADLPKKKQPDCYAKDGNPFGPFWDTFDVSFPKSEFYSPLHFDVHHSEVANLWKEKYPPKDWPVLAFTGAPASFPVQLENRELQRYVVWTDKFEKMAKEFIKVKLPRGSFIGIHLRNGIDWIRACEHIKGSQNLFASPQCLGYKNEKGELYPDLCMPKKELIIRQLKRLIKKVRHETPANEIRSIFVASDSTHMIKDINIALERMSITAHKLEEDNPHLDLAILGLSNHFIGNCISSYSSFVKRERDVRGFPSYFWAFPKEKEHKNHNKHEEL